MNKLYDEVMKHLRLTSQTINFLAAWPTKTNAGGGGGGGLPGKAMSLQINNLDIPVHMEQLYFTCPQWLKLLLEASPITFFVLIYFRLHLKYKFLGQ